MRNFTRWISILLIPLSIQAAGSSSPTLQTLTAANQAEVQNLSQEGLWVGGVVGAYDQGLMTETAYGVANPGSSVAPPLTGYFEIGSVTKSFTGILLAYAVSEIPGLTLDTAIGKFLPEVSGNAYVSSITLRQLAAHVSGLPDDPANLSQAPSYDANNPYATYSEAMFLTYLQSVQPAAAKNPSGQFQRSYSNTGFATLGLVLTRIYSSTFDALIGSKITTPLSMTHTFMSRPGSVVPSPALTPYNLFQKPTSHWTDDVYAPAGAIISTLPDMMLYLKANISLDSSPLGNAMRVSQQLGLGWDSYPGDGIIWKNGQTGGFTSFIALDPVHGNGEVLLSNMASATSDFVITGAMEQLGNFPNSQLYSWAPPANEKFLLPVSSPDAAALTGTYSDVAGKSSDIALQSNRGAVILVFNGQPDLLVFQDPTTPNLFNLYDGSNLSVGTLTPTRTGTGVSGFTLVVPSDGTYQYVRKSAP